MRRLLIAIGASLLLASPASAARSHGAADVIRDWNDLAFAAARDNNASDAQAARLYAMVNVAMYDAVNGTAGAGKPRRAAVVSAPHPVAGDPAVAAARAAYEVLVAAYTSSRGAADTQLAADVAAAPSATAAAQGSEWGRVVGQQVNEARAGDPAHNETQPPGSGPGAFEFAWPGMQFHRLAPFAIEDPMLYVGNGPPALSSPEYAEAFNEVKVVGRRPGSDNPETQALDTFNYWSLGGRTNQPPGGWLQIAGLVSAERDLSLQETARLFALESMALADTVAPTYTTKSVFHLWRPTQAIQKADLDGNPQTVRDESWVQRASRPATSPEYWSGHSAFSAAGATVLAAFFCDDRIPFTLVTDSAPRREPRSFDSFSAAAAEAGRSRVLGGLHFQFSNEDGLTAGRALAREVLSKALLLEDGPTHDGECPR